MLLASYGLTTYNTNIDNDLHQRSLRLTIVYCLDILGVDYAKNLRGGHIAFLIL